MGYKFFIINVVLLLGLIAGATYLQKTYDTDTKLTKTTDIQPIATNTNTEGWQVSTTSAVAPGSTVAPAPVVQKRTVTPTIHRVYNEERDDDN